MERAQFVQHKGKEIFVLDCSDCKPADAHPIIDECARQVRSRPPKSVRTLTIASGGTFDNEIISKLKDLTKGNEPHVHKAALVGITGLYKVVVSAISMFSKREFHLFDTMEEALDFLAEN